jgi:hypothetical protein
MLEDKLNSSNYNDRLRILRELYIGSLNTQKSICQKSAYAVNNHIHTNYSFSPYSPSKAMWMAYKAGLTTAGIMDHDTISGANEFIQAGHIVGIETTIGIECRADFSKTRLHGKKLNNPDQASIAYVTIHGIPHSQIDKVNSFFAPYREYRNIRNKKMISKINDMFVPYDVKIDFNSVSKLSQIHEGGSITERHILYALSLELIKKFNINESLIDFLINSLKLNINKKILYILSDTQNPYCAYDLLGLLKGELVGSFYVNADKECPDIREIVSFSKSIGAIIGYAYLGDVGSSVTNDKKSQKFEDDYIELLFEVLKELNFDAVTYMPSRNSISQLQKVMFLCRKYDFFQISGEDINSPRQPFICEALNNPEFKHLIESTWALIGHEKSATKSINSGMFSKDIMDKYPRLETRVKIFAEVGRLT